MNKKIEKKSLKIKKKINIFDGLIGCKISALFDHYQYDKNVKESYFGEVIGRENGFLIIKPDKMSFVTKKNVSLVILREDKIISFWLYN